METGNALGPLMLKKRVAVLVEGLGEAVMSKPLGEGGVKAVKILGLGGKECAVHVGLEKDLKV